MQQATICYAPHRVFKYVPLRLFLFSLLPWICLALFWYHGPIPPSQIIFFFMLGIGGNYLCKILYDANNIQIILDEQRLQCICMGRSGYQAFSWEELPYGYLNQTSQGHACLILSNTPLDPKYIKRRINLSLSSHIRQEKQGNTTVFLSLPPKAERDAVLAYIGSKINLHKIN